MINYFYPLFFAIGNRMRGSSGIISSIFKNSMPILLTVVLMLFLGLNIFSWMFLKWFIFLFIAYRLGESEGWGKWIGSILDRHPSYNDNEGKVTGIHQIADFFIKEKKDWLNYSRLALCIRGIYWWLPVLLVFYFANAIEMNSLIFGSIFMGITFPVSFEIGRIIKYKIKPYLVSPWEWGEFIYGLMHGILFLYLLI